MATEPSASPRLFLHFPSTQLSLCLPTWVRGPKTFSWKPSSQFFRVKVKVPFTHPLKHRLSGHYDKFSRPWGEEKEWDTVQRKTRAQTPGVTLRVAHPMLVMLVKRTTFLELAFTGCKRHDVLCILECLPQFLSELHGTWTYPAGIEKLPT